MGYSQVFEEGSRLRAFILALSRVLLIAGLICGGAFYSSLTTLMYAPLCLYALIGPKQAIKALSLNYLVLFLNPAFHEPAAETSILRWVIILVAGLRVIPSISARSFRFLVPLLLFFAMVSVLAFLTSSSFAVSFLKVSIFAYFAATVLAAFNSLEQADLDDLRAWFLTITIVVVLLSLPTFAFPKVGFYRNGTGFQGILSHPQTMGIFLAPIAAYLTAGLLLGNSRPSFTAWATCAIVIVLMFFSRARTAALASFLGVGVTLVVSFYSARKAALKPALTRALVVTTMLSIVFALVMFTSQTVSKSVVGYLMKGEKGGIEQAFYISRGAGISFFWKRFLDAPLTGHGFGIDSSNESLKNTHTFLGIPITSSTEFGFLPAAFLEQVGFLGLAFFAPFFLVLIWEAVHQADVGFTAMFFACLFVNMGEAVFFSPGMDGGYQWLLIGLSTAAGPATRSLQRSDWPWKAHQETAEGSAGKCAFNFT